MVVHDLAMEVRTSELVSLVGANGAGKTTLLKTISGLIKAQSGVIEFMGDTIINLDPYQIVERGLVQVPEGRKLFPHMTVMENLELGAYTRAAKQSRAANMEKVFNLLPDLKAKIKQTAGTLSGGQQQMLAIGRGLMTNPKLLILDEPSIGLSPRLTQTMFEIISQIKDQGVTVLLVEQNVHHALGMANRGYVLEQGRIVLQGGGHELLHHEHLKKAYLGM
ncbi:hypothetical protein SY88_15900 [Clostridiales bacterium PH28_bin88]|nr:hypothetical protein SY88_15900 [Clostridiales bacterium PH28_bin88]